MNRNIKKVVLFIGLTFFFCWLSLLQGLVAGVTINAVFGMIDLSLLKITGGYAFQGIELYREEDTRDMGDGYFLSIEGMYQF
ncbi:MAG: hypothetical protein ISS28_00585 [Candidatus Cloacimonetes bacterium]|nr:hypothetical protein [Bacteroidota bacterium]MBL7085584.1 hypothetical protein [Candidatus Cloacimonadota bacterium]